MKKLAHSIAYGLLLLLVCGFFGLCKKDEREDNQRKTLREYITGTLKVPVDEQDGVFFVLLDTSPNPVLRVQANDVVEFYYTAQTLSGTRYTDSLQWTLSGAVFATNVDSLAAQYGLPLTPVAPTGAVRVGAGELIAGLDRGLQRMVLGDHALLLFPFTLGYGEEFVGLVKPESALIFEVRVTKVNGISFP